MRRTIRRDRLLKLPLYGALLCTSYLLIFGISSLNYNHKFGQPDDTEITWERALCIENMGIFAQRLEKV